MRLVEGGKMLEPESIRTCFLFDPSNGRIVHQHEVINFPGARQVDDAELESTTLRLATTLGHDTSKLQALRLSGSFSGEKFYKIDTKSRTLVEVTRPSRPRSGKSSTKKGTGKQTRSAAKRRKR